MRYNPMHPSKPPALDVYTQRRWEESAIRKRLLTGDWQEDLCREIEAHFSADRRTMLLDDMSSNVFMGVCKALNALYNEAPAVGVIETSANQAERLLAKDGMLAMGGLWSIMQRVMYLTIGLREMFLRVDVHDGRLVFIPVSPDMVYAESHPNNPMFPYLVAEMKLRDSEEGYVWTYDVFDLKDEKNPSYKIMSINKDGSLGEDLTIKYLGTDLDGSNYPYRSKEGKPFIPYSCYHAQMIGDQLFDPFTNAEIWRGSLQSAALHSYLIHVIRDCAFPQRYLLGATVDGGASLGIDGDSRRVSISTDPASILVLSPDTDMQGIGQPIIGQWAAAGEPEKLMETIILFERKLAVSGGIRASTVQKMSGDPRSGYAISMSRSDQRDSQRRYKKSMQAGDLMTLRISAMMANRFLGYDFPEQGYTIAYQSIPMSKDELEAVRKDTIEKQLAGYLTKVDALRVFFPDLSEDEAIRYLIEVKRQNIEFNI